MGSGISSNRNPEEKKIHNTAFDLLDTDGDQLVEKLELEAFAKHFHEFMVSKSRGDHLRLERSDPVKYMYDVVGLSYGSRLKKKNFKKLAYIIPVDLWKAQFLPILKKNEINRLSKIVN